MIRLLFPKNIPAMSRSFSLVMRLACAMSPSVVCTYTFMRPSQGARQAICLPSGERVKLVFSAFLKKSSIGICLATDSVVVFSSVACWVFFEVQEVKPSPENRTVLTARLRAPAEAIMVRFFMGSNVLG